MRQISPVVQDATKPFDLTTLTGTFAVNEAGQPINDQLYSRLHQLPKKGSGGLRHV